MQWSNKLDYDVNVTDITEVLMIGSMDIIKAGYSGQVH